MRGGNDYPVADHAGHTYGDPIGFRLKFSAEILYNLD